MREWIHWRKDVCDGAVRDEETGTEKIHVKEHVELAGLTVKEAELKENVWGCDSLWR